MVQGSLSIGVAIAAEIASAPTGATLTRRTRGSRAHTCPALAEFRAEHMPAAIRERLAGSWTVEATLTAEGQLWFTRGLRRSPFAVVPGRPREETFQWVRQPPAGMQQGTVYTDGSLLDNEGWAEGWTVALGWSFVVVDAAGEVVASAHGCPPGWVTTIYGAELWAVQMVVRHVVPGAARILCDCQAVQRDCGRGLKWATAPGRVLARVWAVVAAPGGGAVPDIIWMPAHTAEHDVGVLLKSNGEALTEADRRTNDAADSLAKAAARGRRLQQDLRDRLQREAAEVSEMALWLAKVTVRANNVPLVGGGTVRDSLARAGGPPAAHRGRKRAAEPAALEPASERLFKLPRLAAFRARVLARAAA